MSCRSTLHIRISRHSIALIVVAHSFRHFSPIVFVIRNFDTFEANLVMSTMSPEDMEIERARGQPENAEDSVQRKKNESKKSIETVESEPLVQHTKRSFANSLDCEQSCDRSRRASLEVVRKKRRTSTETDSNDPIPGVRLSNRTEHLPSGVVVPATSDHIRVVFEDESEPIGDVPPNVTEDYIRRPMPMLTFGRTKMEPKAMFGRGVTIGSKCDDYLLCDLRVIHKRALCGEKYLLSIPMKKTSCHSGMVVLDITRWNLLS